MFDPTNYNELTVTESSIPGLFVIKLPVHGDNRGWFKRELSKRKNGNLRLTVVRYRTNNISFNDKTGATRGLHAEPWNKFISTANGRVFGAWCDLVKEIASAEFSRTRLIRVRQFSFLKAWLTAIRHLMIM